MDRERWKRIDEIFHAALDRESSVRAKFLAEACDGDDSLRRELERLIACHEKESNLFERPPSDLAAALLAKEGTYKGTISHYRILEKIGSGGMGEVYLAEDTRLNRKVALKLLPLEFTKDQERIRRFQREARAVSALNHPNILTIHDIGQTESSSFIATEYIDGESLRQRILQSKMPLKEVLTIVIQVAEALDAAHQAGIIHRDIKPENIMLRKDGYVKVLDFGLAKLTEPDTGASDLETHTPTQTGIVIGTVRYMSPEQTRGQKLDARTDVFSLGIVLYEMITNRVPFYGRTTADTIAAILQQNPAELRNSGSFPEELQWIVTKALAKDPEERYQSTKDLLTDLKRLRKRLEITEDVKTADSKSAFLFRRFKPIAVRVLLVVLLAIAAIFFAYWFSSKSKISSFSKEQLQAQRVRPSIAVIGFKNLSSNPENAWLSVAISEMLSTELAQGEQLRSIPGETVHRVKKELSLPDVQAFEKNTLYRLGSNLAADYILIGSYIASGKRIRLNLTLQDTRTGQTKNSFSENGSLDELFELTSQTASKLRKYLDVQTASKTSSDTASFSSNPEVIRLYAEGLLKLRFFDYGGAKVDFEKAIEMEPNFTMARSGLSAAWTKIGYLKKAKEEAQKAMDLSSNLSREERLLTQARYFEAAEEYEKASEIYQTLFNLFPDNAEYGLQLAETRLETSQAREALIVVDALRSIPSQQKEDPRIDITQAKALEALGNYKETLPILDHAIEKAENSGARRLLADAYLWQARVSASLGENKKSKSLYEKANQLYTAVGDQDSVAEDVIWEGRKLIEEGKTKEGENLLNQALRIYETIGNRFGVAMVYFTIAKTSKNEKAMNEAFSLAIKKAQEIEHREYMATILNDWGARNWEDGNLPAAQQHFEQSLLIYRQLNKHEYAAGLMSNLGHIYQEQGNLEKAEALFTEALDVLQTLGHNPDMARMMLALAMLYRENGHLRKAKEFCEKTIPIVEKTGEKSDIARALAFKAIILIDEGRLSEAREIWEAAKKNDETNYQVQATFWEFLFVEGKHEELGREYEKARKDFSAGEIDTLNYFIANLKKDTMPVESRRIALALLDDPEWNIPNYRASLLAIIAQTYLSEGKANAAKNVISKLAPSDEFHEFFLDRIDVDLVRARVLSSNGNQKEATDLTERLLKETQRSGYVKREYEILLTLGEIQLKSGKQKEGIRTLEKLKDDATKSGYLFVSKKASSLLN